MRLTDERSGPWLRALRSAVSASAPSDDFVPLAAALAHLDALSPELSSDILAPAELDATSGMPALSWMTRASAEQSLARPNKPVSDVVQRADPKLARRMLARNRLAEHLASHALLPALEVAARVRRVGEATSAELVFDHIDPVGHWVRTRVSLSRDDGEPQLGLVHVASSSRIVIADGVVDLFARHVTTPLDLLRAALMGLCEGRVVRVSRARIGPFWFPGGPGPAQAPAAVMRTLVLHLVHEVIADDIVASVVSDVLRPTPPVRAPDCHGYRTRRVAVLSSGVPAVRGWLGPDIVILPFH